MGKYSKEDYEFEKNKQEILKLTQNRHAMKKEEHASVWEFEIEEHRKRKRKEKFMMFGAGCGILSMMYILITTLLNYL
ncbi:MAG: hypothetical protein JEZ08_16965 [Clostridiales bacterium]|nr:hypothetical protein [Clostridiales bacterium]